MLDPPPELRRGPDRQHPGEINVRAVAARLKRSTNAVHKRRQELLARARLLARAKLAS